MKYLCTVLGPAADHIEGAPCATTPVGPHDIATVRVRNGRVSVSQVMEGEAAGEPIQFLLEAWDMSDAIRLASHHPSARWATLEVRPIPVFEPP
jgi:hypothetical protein